MEAEKFKRGRSGGGQTRDGGSLIKMKSGWIKLCGNLPFYNPSKKQSEAILKGKTGKNKEEYSGLKV